MHEVSELRLGRFRHYVFVRVGFSRLLPRAPFAAEVGTLWIMFALHVWARWFVLFLATSLWNTFVGLVVTLSATDVRGPGLLRDICRRKSLSPHVVTRREMNLGRAGRTCLLQET